MQTEQPIIVAIESLVYNHEFYLRDCLEGIVMQKTNFRFVVIVHDDASTDNSAAIIREYERKYPEIIKPIYEAENQWSKPDGSLGRILDNALQATGAKYITWCEGDDYWTDPLKLQKQVDFMESHPECSVTFHRCKHYSAYSREWSSDGLESFCTNDEPTEITIPRFFKSWCTQPLTMMYRRNMFDTSLSKRYKNFWDTHIIYHLLSAGKGYMLPFVGGVHVVHSGGMSGGLTSDVQRVEFALVSADELYDVNRNEYTKTNWRDTVLWAWNVYARANEKQKLHAFIRREWCQFPCAMTGVIWTQMKRKIKGVFSK